MKKLFLILWLLVLLFSCKKEGLNKEQFIGVWSTSERPDAVDDRYMIEISTNAADAIRLISFISYFNTNHSYPFDVISSGYNTDKSVFLFEVQRPLYHQTITGTCTFTGSGVMSCNWHWVSTGSISEDYYETKTFYKIYQ